jgi:hypothetical protein
MNIRSTMNLLPKKAYESPRIGNEAAPEIGMEMKKSQSAVEPSKFGGGDAT